MELSQFTVGLIFVFLPGIIGVSVSERLTDHHERKSYELLAYALFLGCASHVAYSFLFYLFGPRSWLEEDRWLNLMFVPGGAIQSTVVAFTSGIGALLGLAVAFTTTRSWLHRFAGWFGISKKFAEVDVWAHLLNFQGPQWVVVRDHEKNLMYQGYVRAFSTSEEPRELFLEQATVFQNDTGEKMYDVAVLYLAFEKTNVTLEIF